MAFVKTFVVRNDKGVPDRYIQNFLVECEKEGPVHVHTALVRTGTALLLTVFATQQDTWDSLGVEQPIPVTQIPTAPGDETEQ